MVARADRITATDLPDEAREILRFHEFVKTELMLVMLSYRAVIPGRREAASPESITTGGYWSKEWRPLVFKATVPDYGFRARAFGAPRNDESKSDLALRARRAAETARRARFSRDFMQRRPGHHGQASQRRLACACALYQLARDVLAAFMVAAMRMRPEGVIERDFHVGQGPIIQLRHDVVSFKDAVCRNLAVSGCRNSNIFGALWTMWNFEWNRSAEARRLRNSR